MKKAKDLKVGDAVEFINGKQANVLKILKDKDTLYLLFDNGRYYICIENDDINLPS
jgi:dsDNA-specific endonuclease/ATPase MutS2